MKILKGNKAMYAFVRGRWKAICNWNGSSFNSYDKLFKTEASCQKFCDQINKYKKEERDKLFPVPEFTSPFRGMDFDFHRSWDSLKPIIDEIHKYALVHPAQVRKISKMSIVVGIKPCWEACVEFCEWFNSQPKSNKHGQ